MNYYFGKLAGVCRKETVNMLVLSGTLYYVTLVLTVTMQMQLNNDNDIEFIGILKTY